MSLKVAVRPFKWGIDQAFMLTQPTTTLIFSNYPGGGKANASSVNSIERREFVHHASSEATLIYFWIEIDIFAIHEFLSLKLP